MRRAAAVAVLMVWAHLGGACWADAQGVSAAAADALRLVESDDAYQQRLGFLRLEALREPATLPALRAYLTHREEDLRAAAVRAVAAIGGPASVPEVLRFARHDKSAQVRWAAILAVEPFAALDAAVLPVLIEALQDYSNEVRMAAVDVISRIDAPEARAAILERRKREQRPDVRRVLQAAMDRMGL